MVLLMTTTTNIMYAGNDDSIREKVEKLLAQLTLEEKTSMLHGNSKFTIAAIERLGIPEWTMSDGPHGVREEINRHDWDPAGWQNDFSTYLPVGTALAATWNPDLAYQFGTVLGREARARKKDVILGPGINIHRTPLCGRNFEYMSEDPFLISKLVVPYIQGVQEQDVAACVKHFAANNQEFERFQVDIEMDERTLREIYLPGFKAAVKEGNVLTVMSAYNKFRGKWCSENSYLLSDILKKEWGFEGVVISDWDGTHSTLDAAMAGLDIEMGTNKDDYKSYFFADALKEAIENGKVPLEVIDDKVRRILTAMIKSNVFDKNRSKGEYISGRHFETAKKVAEEAVVLLKNSNHILPLNEKNIKTLAVIGDNAIAKHALGGGSSGIKAKYEITPLVGLKNKLGGEINIKFSRGYQPNTAFDWENGRTEATQPNSETKEDLIKKAVETASEADFVVMFLGLNHHYDMESVDRTEMNLPFGQDDLVKAVLRANPKTVVVLIGGLALDIREWVDDVPAIIQGWYAGSEAGNVFADVLFGDVNPSGKLPFTYPEKLEDTPAYHFGDLPGRNLKVEYKEGIFVGYRYFDTYHVKPRFAFGHGLSYSTFEYQGIKLSSTHFSSGKELELSVSVINTGKYSGSEVVQLYIEDSDSSVKRPLKELKAFSKVFLQPGEAKEILFKIDESLLSFYDVSHKSFRAEPGNFKIYIGSASDDIRLITEFAFLSEK